MLLFHRPTDRLQNQIKRDARTRTKTAVHRQGTNPNERGRQPNTTDPSRAGQARPEPTPRRSSALGTRAGAPTPPPSLSLFSPPPLPSPTVPPLSGRTLAEGRQDGTPVTAKNLRLHLTPTRRRNGDSATGSHEAGRPKGRTEGPKWRAS